MTTRDHSSAERTGGLGGEQSVDDLVEQGDGLLTVAEVHLAGVGLAALPRRGVGGNVEVVERGIRFLLVPVQAEGPAALQFDDETVIPLLLGQFKHAITEILHEKILHLRRTNPAEKHHDLCDQLLHFHAPFVCISNSKYTTHASNS